MNINLIHEAIKELRAEAKRLDYAIKTIEDASKGKAPRGRPPKFLCEDGVGPLVARSLPAPEKPKSKRAAGQSE